MLSHSQSSSPRPQQFKLHSKVAPQKKRTTKWNCTLPELLIGDYLIIPLTSTKMLKSEGCWMNNCSREYADQCSKNLYALFSIRTRSGERLATLGLENDCGFWKFDQCYGPSNIEVMEERIEYLDENGEYLVEYYPTEMYYATQEVLRLINRSDGSGADVFC
jgi:hypothetical protein